jgi:hypothetical protein
MHVSSPVCLNEWLGDLSLAEILVDERCFYRDLFDNEFLPSETEVE